jgi:hypothetical protein
MPVTQTDSELLKAFYEDIQGPPVRSHYANKPVGSRGKTVKENLDLLPKEYRDLALQYIDVKGLSSRSCKLHGALTHAFMWSNTDEGHDFWQEVACWGMEGCETLPPIP